jgi:enoyl-CoA hydratase
MHKMVVNQIMLTMGLEQAQMSATIFDGITRHNPEGLWFRRYAQTEGFKAAIEWRDSGRPIPEGDEARALIRENGRKTAGPIADLVQRAPIGKVNVQEARLAAAGIAG